MGWTNYEENIAKENKEKSLSSKILIWIITCVIIILILLLALFINIQVNNFSIYVDGDTITSVSKEDLIKKIDNVTYINIEAFAKLVGYEYHAGEYKAFTIEQDKCYVQKYETASFYANDNKVYKLPINQLDKDYEEYSIDNKVKNINGYIYAPIEAIKLAFNVVIEEANNYLRVYTLQYLIDFYHAKTLSWGYTGLSEYSLENYKAILYGYLIVNKEGELCKVINLTNTQDIIPAKYTSIEYLESMNEFMVVNSYNQVGILNADGTTKIENVYQAIEVLDKQKNLYIVKQNEKFGVVKGNNVSIVFPEYDIIGLDSTINNTSKNKRMLLDTLIPVYKNGKCGAFNTDGKLIIKVEYDNFGYSLNSIEINGTNQVVDPLLSIEMCKGIIVNSNQKYGLISINGDRLISVTTDGIYAKKGIQDEKSKYFVLYNGREVNVVDRLNITEDNQEENVDTDINNNITVDNSMVDNTTNMENNVINANSIVANEVNNNITINETN